MLPSASPVTRLAALCHAYMTGEGTEWEQIFEIQASELWWYRWQQPPQVRCMDHPTIPGKCNVNDVYRTSYLNYNARSRICSSCAMQVSHIYYAFHGNRS